jgi:hypothetical protein
MGFRKNAVTVKKSQFYHAFLTFMHFFIDY